jgi:hypothetical protein
MACKGCSFNNRAQAGPGSPEQAERGWLSGPAGDLGPLSP